MSSIHFIEMILLQNWSKMSGKSYNSSSNKEALCTVTLLRKKKQKELDAYTYSSVAIQKVMSSKQISNKYLKIMLKQHENSMI